MKIFLSDRRTTDIQATTFEAVGEMQGVVSEFPSVVQIKLHVDCAAKVAEVKDQLLLVSK